MTRIRPPVVRDDNVEIPDESKDNVFIMESQPESGYQEKKQ